MIWLRLIWWTFWRGLLYGGIEGAVFGTLISPFDGTIYGVLIGTILGALFGLVNGIAFALMTRFFFPYPLNRPRYVRWSLTLIVPLDLILTLICGLLIGILGLIAALITATTAYFLITHFADYTADQLADLPRRSQTS